MRYLILLSAVLMQMCLGATYSWSVYVQPIKTLTYLQQGPVQIPFTTFYFVFPLTMMVAGSLLPKVGPRISAMAGGFLFGGGWILASHGTENFILTTLGIGVLSGIGAGLAYIVPIAVCIRWFPKNKGLVTGVAVAGFGGGAALVSQVGGWLMHGLAKTPFESFFIFGIIFMITIVSAGSVMRYPKDNLTKDQSNQIRVRQLLLHPAFRLLYFSMFIGLAAGFAINANLKELYQGEADGVKLGITAVSLFALANASGRIVWGMIFDKIQATTAIQANLLFQALVLMAAPTALNSSTGFILIALLTGFNYGGVLVIYVSSASRCWGAERVSQIYGWLFSSNIPASIAPIIAGMVFDTFNSFNFALYGLSALLIIAVLLVKLTPTNRIPA
ncbi:MAG: OFA family MFS transporter [Desulfobulbaceae bacterium]|nr:OFA family MFS transporter [Desulfobulbaceae bacterium]